jgi:ribosome-associated protein
VQIPSGLVIPDNEYQISAVRAQGAGGQNVNKTSTAVHLRFDIRASSLPDHCKEQLLQLRDQRITREGVVVIKAQQYRSQDQNREAALRRLHELVAQAVARRAKRKPTRPPGSSKRKRLDGKVMRGRIKALRSRITDPGIS